MLNELHQVAVLVVQPIPELAIIEQGLELLVQSRECSEDVRRLDRPNRLETGVVAAGSQTGCRSSRRGEVLASQCDDSEPGRELTCGVGHDHVPHHVGVVCGEEVAHTAHLEHAPRRTIRSGLTVHDRTVESSPTGETDAQDVEIGERLGLGRPPASILRRVRAGWTRRAAKLHVEAGGIPHPPEQLAGTSSPA